MLQAYFRSGWAFLIPYLAAYLLYAWLNWPVNASAGEGSRENGAGSWVPCLLHVYWLFHALHLVLGAIALRSGWTKMASEKAEWRKQNTSLPASGLRSPVSAAAYRLLPWLCLALLFYIPGLYLEWPSDPWEHLRRINEWHILDQVTAHSSWKKSSYFLPYSLTGHTTGLPQLRLLNFYYTGICLLLCWQYYRLARAMGWEFKYAFGFVAVNVLCSGNSVFSFYRYYSLSSSILGQLFTVVLVRSALEYAIQYRESLGRKPARWIIAAGARASVLVVCIAANHLQGIALAGLGVASICAWHLLTLHSRRPLLLAAGIFLLANAVTYLFWPRHPTVAEQFVSEGWLTTFHTYNLAPNSVSAIRAWQIISLLGALDLACALLLWRKSPTVASCLALGPFLWLSSPVFTIPLANSIAQHGPSAIYALHRMFFAIPVGLSLVACLRWLDQLPGRWTASVRVGFAAAVLACLLTPPGLPTFNRTWHFLAEIPADLTLSSIRRELAVFPFSDRPNAPTLTSAPLAYALTTTRPTPAELPRRLESTPRSSLLEARADYIRNHWRPPNFDANGRPPGEMVSRQDWSLVEGRPPVHEQLDWLDGGEINAIQNEPGNGSDLLLGSHPIEPGTTYTVEAIVRRLGAPGSHFLAVAWFDSSGRRLDASTPAPAGAGSPPGWDNGIYSYFGMTGGSPPETWTVYRQSFGPGAGASIPLNASSFRPGIRFNYAGATDAMMQVASLAAWKRGHADPTIDGMFRLDVRPEIAVGAPRNAFTAGSIAAHMSNHWLPWQLAYDLAGSFEELQAARSKTFAARVLPNQVENILP